jgi:hypothetical protein
MRGALSDERMGLSFIIATRVTVSSYNSVVSIVFYMLLNTYTYTKFTGPLSIQAQYSRSCPIISSSCYNSSLVTGMVVCLTATKFKPHIFLVSGFALSNVANIFIFMILYDFCLFPA